ncbi:MAG: glycosyl transferase [Deltaproteobacteria bacterium RBG_13_61_14]|nr:MAG: glycosyl transferase [Deltaproteobacteria bacterium RBG_13_61_14]
MTKLIVQIPCWNEEANLAAVIAGIPRRMEGVDAVEVLVIDDGSTDRTAEAATAAGADHLVRFTSHRGLARAFAAGLDAALKLGADLIVNTDADGQYRGEDIPKLIAPILAGEADLCVGDRGIAADRDYPALKQGLQRLGSWVVRRLSETDVADAASGFRAFSRQAALELSVVSEFTYTLETLIAAGKKKLSVRSVPVAVNPPARPSRLYASVPEYLRKSLETMVRVYAMFEPMRVFALIGALPFAAGSAIGLWFLYEYFTTGGKGHVQALILAAVLLIIGFQVMIFGLLADLIAQNRKLIEDLLRRIKERP